MGVAILGQPVALRNNQVGFRSKGVNSGKMEWASESTDLPKNPQHSPQIGLLDTLSHRMGEGRGEGSHAFSSLRFSFRTSIKIQKTANEQQSNSDTRPQPPPAPARRRRRIFVHRYHQRGHETEI